MAIEGTRFDEEGIAILVGLFCGFVYFLFFVNPSPYIYVPLAFVVGSFAMLLSHLNPAKRWFTWLCLILPYVGLTSWIVISIKKYHAKYEGAFFRSEIYWSTIYLFVCPFIASLLGPLFAKKRLFQWCGLLIVLGVGISCHVYITRNSLIIVPTNNSFEIADNSARVRIDFTCRYSKSIDYLRFAYVEDGGGCGGNSKVTVINKDPMAGLTRDAIWVINGVEKPAQMHPRPYGDDVALLMDFAPHEYDAVPTWSTDIPIIAIAKAQEVQFRWGDIHLQFQPDQIQSLRQHVMEFKKKLKMKLDHD